jgi:hypothetical protein
MPSSIESAEKDQYNIPKNRQKPIPSTSIGRLS